MHYKLGIYNLVNMYFACKLSYHLKAKPKSIEIGVLLYDLRILPVILKIVLQKSFLKLIARIFRYNSLFKTFEVRYSILFKKSK